MTIGWIFIALATWINSPQRPGHRAQSIGNLKELVLATLNTAEETGRFPPAGPHGAPRHPGYGWAVEILPAMDGRTIYHEIDFTKPWDHPANAQILSAEIPGYCNPAIPETKDERGYGLIHYAGNVRLLGRSPALAFDDVTDGLARTLMLGEIAAGFRPWGDPDNLRDPAAGLHRGPNTFGGPWKDEITIFAFADGSVHRVANETTPDVLNALATPDGGEDVEFPK